MNSLISSGKSETIALSRTHRVNFLAKLIGILTYLLLVYTLLVEILFPLLNTVVSLLSLKSPKNLLILESNFHQLFPSVVSVERTLDKDRCKNGKERDITYLGCIAECQSLT